MNHVNHILPRLLLVAALALPCAARAQDAPPPGPEGLQQHGMQPRRPGPPPFGHAGGGEGPPFLRGVDLSEAQRDKLFALMHAQAPLLREQHKLAARAYEALHALARSERFDEARGAALAQSAAQAMAGIALQHARTEQQVMALLTPAQRKQIEQREQDGPPRPQ
jgi:protein CpxP